MRNKRYTLVVMATLWFVCGMACAELYQWVDKHGNTVLSDKPPKDLQIKAEKKALPTKISVLDYAPDQQMKSMQRLVDAMKSEQQENQQKKKHKEYMAKKCRELAEYIHVISGRVQFIDDNDQPVAVSEEERAGREHDLKSLYQKRCS